MTAEQTRDYKELVAQMRAQGGYDETLVRKSFEFCVAAHEGQKRCTN